MRSVIAAILILTTTIAAAASFEELAAEQDRALDKDGRKAVIENARKQLEADGSAVNHLLLARLLPPKEAARVLEGAARDFPDDLLVHIHLTRAYLGSANDRKAEREARRVIDLAPEDPRGHHLMGLATEARGRPKNAERYYEKALEKEPGRPATLIALALLLHRLERSDEGLVLLTKAAGGKGSSQIQLGLGELYLLRREFPAAIEAFTKVMGDDALRPKALARRGYAELKTGNLEKAIRDLNQAIRMRPSAYLPRVHLGVAQEWQGKLDEARNAYMAARDMEPERPEAISRLGYLDWIQKDLRSAEKAQKEAIKADENYILAHLYLAQIEVEKGDLNGGRRAYLKALKIDETCYQAHLELARVYIEMGRLPDALKSATRALELRPTDTEAITVKGQVYFEMTKYDEAQATLVVALDLDPKYALAYRALGRVAEAREQFDQAAVHYGRAVEFDPKDPFARYLLGILSYEQGNDAGALEHLSAYLDIMGEDKDIERLVQQLENK